MMVEARAAAFPAAHPDPGSAFESDSRDRIDSETAALADDDWRPARGFIMGIIMAVPLWCLIGFLSWLVLVM
jgi:hypothetical protein